MTSRALLKEDLERLKELHEKFYPQFEFPTFLKLLNAFVIEDDKGIIMAGGIEHVAEIVLVTDKDRSRTAIGRALLEAKAISLFTGKSFGIRDMYAFVDNPDYAKHLIQHGFEDMNLQALRIRVI